MYLSVGRAEGVADQVGIAYGHVEQGTFARGAVVSYGSLDEVSAVVEFVAVDLLPPVRAPPPAQACAAVGYTGGQVSVVLLCRRYQCDDAVQVVVQSGIVVCCQRVGGSLYDLVWVGIVEREVAPVLALLEPTGDGEVVKPAVDLALVQCRRYGYGAVGLDAWCPEAVLEVYLRKGDFDYVGCRLVIVLRPIAACCQP